MDHFTYIDDQLHAEQTPLAEIARRFGTPCYVYSRATLERHWRAFDDAFGDYPHRICYAVKANDNLAVLNLLARLGGGFDIVSGGELARVIRAGGAPKRVLFSGVGKQDWEIAAALDAGIDCFNIESESELARIDYLARERRVTAGVSVRINPDIDAGAHPYIATGQRENKFGLTPNRARAVYQRAHELAHIRIRGVACHIGSQLLDLTPYCAALDCMLDFIEQLRDDGIELEHLDFGGGLGVRYHDETPPSPQQYADAIIQRLRARAMQLQVVIEPGRAIVGNAGVLLTRVIGIKRGAERNFCITDAAMNDLLRPALYQAHQQIVEVSKHKVSKQAMSKQTASPTQYDVVGPVCETGDFLGLQRELNVREGDLLAVRTAGAYCAVMSSNYNARPRAAEVMVDAADAHLVRARETVEALYKDESMLP